MSKTVLWVAGGLLAGSGILIVLLGGFGVPGGDVALVFSTLGYDGLDNVQLSSQGWMGIGTIIVGGAMMITASKDAWKHTGGY